MNSAARLLMGLAVFLMVSDLICISPILSKAMAVCKTDSMINHSIMPSLNHSLQLYKKIAGSIIPSKSRIIPELAIPNKTADVNQSITVALTGTQFMFEAISVILQSHTSAELPTEATLRHHLNNLTNLLSNNSLLGCMQVFFGRQQCPLPTRIYQPSKTYAKKVWSYSVLNESITFVSWLQEFLKNHKHPRRVTPCPLFHTTKLV
ncbi:hypothetical protein GN956_G13715 [Arapaima gigas]